MATIKDSTKEQVKPTASKPRPTMSFFGKHNYRLMVLGLVVIGLGFILMAGGKSEDPNVFNDNVVNGFQRITLAPILVVAGLVIEIFAIMKKPKSTDQA